MSFEISAVQSRSEVRLRNLKGASNAQGKLTIYISGAMTDIKGFNKDEFFRVEDIITKAGHIALNPARNPLGLEYSNYIRLSLADLLVSDAVVRLRGWQESKGALAEVFTANSLGLLMIDE